jgi:hypothetical protein
MPRIFLDQVARDEERVATRKRAEDLETSLLRRKGEEKKRKLVKTECSRGVSERNPSGFCRQASHGRTRFSLGTRDGNPMGLSGRHDSMYCNATSTCALQTTEPNNRRYFIKSAISSNCLIFFFLALPVG